MLICFFWCSIKIFLLKNAHPPQMNVRIVHLSSGPFISYYTWGHVNFILTLYPLKIIKSQSFNSYVLQIMFIKNKENTKEIFNYPPPDSRKKGKSAKACALELFSASFTQRSHFHLIWYLWITLSFYFFL